MAERTIVVTAKSTKQLFDAIKEVGDGGVALGTRLVSALLAEPSTGELVGLEFYGVELSEISDRGESQ